MVAIPMSGELVICCSFFPEAFFVSVCFGCTGVFTTMLGHLTVVALVAEHGPGGRDQLCTRAWSRRGMWDLRSLAGTDPASHALVGKF